MKGTYLGEFEEIVLLVVASLYKEAYGVAVKKTIHEQIGRKVTLSTVHASLHRLEKKGFLRSQFGEATKVRGGKRKKYFTLTAAGTEALEHARMIRNKLWDTIPPAALSKLQASAYILKPVS